MDTAFPNPWMERSPKTNYRNHWTSAGSCERGGWHHRAFARGEHPREYHGVAPSARSHPRAVLNPFEVKRGVLTAIRRWCESPPRVLSLCLEMVWKWLLFWAEYRYIPIWVLQEECLCWSKANPNPTRCLASLALSFYFVVITAGWTNYSTHEVWPLLGFCSFTI